MKRNPPRFPVNHRLREARLQRHWTQSDQAAALHELAIAEGYPTLGIDANTISRWERGKQHPQAHHVFLLSKLHGKSPQDLGMNLQGKGMEKPASFDPLVALYPRGISRRSEKKTELSTSEPAIRLDPDRWERLYQVIGNPMVVNDSVVQSFEDQTKALFELSMSISAPQISSHLAFHLDNLTNALSGSEQSELRQRLIATTGETAVLAGWMAWDSGDLANSQRLYRVAAQAASQVEDSELQAYCLGCMSYASSRAGQHAQALEQLGQAMEQANPSSITHAWLEARRAEELASLGEESALELIELNRSRFEGGKLEDERAWSVFLTPTRISNFQVNVYLSLGKYEEAKDQAFSALDSVEYLRLRPVVLAEAASICLKEDDLERGVELAESALFTAIEVQSHWALGRLHRLRNQIQVYATRNPRAAQLSAQFFTLVR